jgi:UDP-N-acetylmuramate dehydrogenase
MQIDENIPLGPLTTFGIGGPARWFVRAASEDDIAAASEWARSRAVPLFILGGGSNLLVADSGFDGLVLHIALLGIESTSETDNRVFRAAAGEDWDTFVQQTVDVNCAGLECLAGIPGTVGGTPVQNVGAYGQEVANTIARVRAFDLATSSFVEFTTEECGFAYRRSRFNTVDCGRFIVTRVDYRLTSGGSPSLRYAELQRFFAGKSSLSLAEVADQVRKIRQGKGMLLVEGDIDCHSAGSFFKNPIVSAEWLTEIALAAGKEPPQFPAGSGPQNAGKVKVPAAWLIEQAGYSKGYARGAAGISSRHTLALINRGGATAADIMALAEEIRSGVEARFGVTLEMEPVRLGFNN